MIQKTEGGEQEMIAWPVSNSKAKMLRGIDCKIYVRFGGKLSFLFSMPLC